MDVEVHVLSSISRRFLEVLGKLDQLMPLLQTLEIHEVITPQAVDVQRATLKRQVRNVANGARNFAVGLRRRMNAADARGDGTVPHAPAGAEDAPPVVRSADAHADAGVDAEVAQAPVESRQADAEAPAAAEQ
jgi:hypothetical protein